MKKVYLIDVSRRLLIFVLLLGGYITQAAAADIYVPVKDVLSYYEGTSDANAEQLNPISKVYCRELSIRVIRQRLYPMLLSEVTVGIRPVIWWQEVITTLLK